MKMNVKKIKKMGNTNHYPDFQRSFRQPVDYLPRIRQLKQSLFDGNSMLPHEIVRELEKVATEERVHLLEEYLLFVLSRLVYVQGESTMMEFTYSDIVYNLSRIQTHNQLAEGEYYIASDDWRSHFDVVLDAAIEVSFDTCLTNECRGWSGEFDIDALWQETQKILALTYLEDRAAIDRALRSIWSSYTFFPY